MTSPRIHIVAYDVRPISPAQPRIAAIVHELLARQYQVTLYTAHPPWVNEGLLKEHPGVEVVVHKDRLAQLRQSFVSKSPPPSHTRGTSETSTNTTRQPLLKRLGKMVLQTICFPDDEVWWTLSLLTSTIKRVQKHDTLLTCSRPESTLLLGAIHSQRGTKWWVDFADGWCFQSLRHSGPSLSRFRLKLESYLENYLINLAQGISTVNPEIATWYQTLRHDGKTAIYPNLIPIEYTDPTPASDPKIPKLGPLKIAYLGRLSHSDQERSLNRLLATLSVWLVNTSSKPNEIEFHFYGTYGASDQLQLQKLRALGFGVYLNEALPREKLAEKSSSFDGGLVISSPKQTGSTSKLLDYLGLRLPIFAIAPEGSHIHSIIATSGCGHMINFTDKTDHAAKQWQNFILGIRSRTLVVNEDTRAAFLPSPHAEIFVDELFSF